MANAYLKVKSQGQRFSWLTFLFIAVVFFIASQNLYFSKRGIGSYNASESRIATAVSEGSLSRQIALLALGLFGVASLIIYRRSQRRINGWLGSTMLFFAAWAALSLGWSEDSALTFRRLVLFAVLCLAAAAIARRFSLRQIILLTFSWSVLFLFIGVAAEIALGTFHPFAPGYRFAGTLHPNHQGINCALVLLSGIGAADTVKRGRMTFRVCAIVGLVFLILTGSRTSFAATLLALVAYSAFVPSRRAKIALGFTLGIVSCILLMVLGNASIPDIKNAVMLGRNDSASSLITFNGRTEIWEEVGFYIRQRPIIGYGYGGFWTPRHIAEISSRERWGVGEGHSSYVDCLLDLGVVGLLALVLVLLGGVARAFTLYKRSRDPALAFSGVFLIFFLANGFLESAILQSPLVLFLCLTVLLHLSFRRCNAPKVI